MVICGKNGRKKADQSIGKKEKRDGRNARILLWFEVCHERRLGKGKTVVALSTPGMRTSGSETSWASRNLVGSDSFAVYPSQMEWRKEGRGSMW